jgi:ADP-ribose pyrophosphatase YjhB (NUDIX family)
MFTIGVFTIVFNPQGQVLLCHRRDLDIWNLPGGGMEIGELPPETAIRETREETGLEVEIERLVGVYSKPDNNDLVFVFTSRVVAGQLTINDEADQLRYFSLDALPANTIPKHVERLQDAVANHPQPVFRRQTSPPTREFLNHLTTTRNNY